jgi:hypothetical protein
MLRLVKDNEHDEHNQAIGLKCETYRNLHRNTFSVRHKGKVIAYSRHLIIKDCVLFVQPAGRLRVLEEGVKNVHAGVRGTVIEMDCISQLKNFKATLTPIRYNPWDCETWVTLDGEPVKRADFVLLTNNQAFIIEKEEEEVA